MTPAYRLIAVDLDGTLLDPEGRVSPVVNAAVACAVERGATVAIATGRRHRSTVAIAREVPASTYVIVQHGALIKRTDDHATVWSAPIDGERALAVAGFLMERELEPLIFVDAYEERLDFYYYGEGAPRSWATQDFIARARGYGGRLSRGGAIDYPVTEVVALGEREHLEPVLGGLEERFGEEFRCHMLKSPRYEFWFVEVMSPLAGKGRALMELARRLGIAPEETAAVGDDINDLDMFAAAGVAIAMGNAAEEVRRAADFVVGTNAEDGAAAALDALTGEAGGHMLAPPRA